MLLDKLLRRGLISGIYPESPEYRTKLAQLLTKPTTVYTGFDATGKSLHVGHLATIVSSLYFHSQGHQVILVIGDATAQIGDPSGHIKDRSRIPASVISENANSIEKTLRRLFKNFTDCFINSTHEGLSIRPNCRADSIQTPIIVRNSQWYQGENVVDFVDKIFRDIRVGGLLHKKSIKERLKSHEGMNMAEFSYQIFQAYDWLELRRRYDCKLQIGGNDQQGNIYTGHELIKKCLHNKESIGLLAPLITNSKGKKLGKTSESAKTGIWLEPDLTSPFDLYQYFLKTTDSDVKRFLQIFSFLSDEHIDALISTYLKNKSDIRHCQRQLAKQACLLVHSQEGLSEAVCITESLFSNKTS